MVIVNFNQTSHYLYHVETRISLAVRTDAETTLHIRQSTFPFIVYYFTELKKFVDFVITKVFNKV